MFDFPRTALPQAGRGGAHPVTSITYLLSPKEWLYRAPCRRSRAHRRPRDCLPVDGRCPCSCTRQPPSPSCCRLRSPAGRWLGRLLRVCCCVRMSVAVRMTAAALGLAVELATVTQAFEQLGDALRRHLMRHGAQRRGELRMAPRYSQQQPAHAIADGRHDDHLRHAGQRQDGRNGV